MKWALPALLVGLVLGYVVRGDDADVARWQAEAKAHRQQAVAWFEVAQRISARVDTLVVRQTERVTRVERVTDSVLVALEAERPDCGPVIAACQARIQIERDTARVWRDLLEQEKEAAATFRDAAVAALDAERAQRKATTAAQGFRLPWLNLPVSFIADYTLATGRVGATVATKVWGPIHVGIRWER